MSSISLNILHISDVFFPLWYILGYFFSAIIQFVDFLFSYISSYFTFKMKFSIQIIFSRLEILFGSFQICLFYNQLFLICVFYSFSNLLRHVYATSDGSVLWVGNSKTPKSPGEKFCCYCLCRLSLMVALPSVFCHF